MGSSMIASVLPSAARIGAAVLGARSCYWISRKVTDLTGIESPIGTLFSNTVPKKMLKPLIACSKRLYDAVVESRVRCDALCEKGSNFLISCNLFRKDSKALRTLRDFSFSETYSKTLNPIVEEAIFRLGVQGGSCFCANIDGI